MEARRARRIKIGLAGLAVLGLGAALTSAAWTDQVLFKGNVTTGSFNLQGALPADQAAPAAPTDDSAWKESDDETSVELDFGTIGYAPDETITVTGYVRVDPDSSWTGDLTAIDFVGAPDWPDGVTASVDWVDGTDTTGLEPGDTAALEVVVVADETVEAGAADAAFVVQVDGESVDYVGAP